MLICQLIHEILHLTRIVKGPKLAFRIRAIVSRMIQAVDVQDAPPKSRQLVEGLVHGGGRHEHDGPARRSVRTPGVRSSS